MKRRRCLVHGGSVPSTTAAVLSLSAGGAVVVVFARLVVPHRVLSAVVFGVALVAAAARSPLDAAAGAAAAATAATAAPAFVDTMAPTIRHGVRSRCMECTSDSPAERGAIVGVPSFGLPKGHCRATSSAAYPLASASALASSANSKGGRDGGEKMDEGRRAPLSNAEIARYSRHLVLSDVGMSGQMSLRDSSVLVIGAGGLGSPCLLYLAAAGVGHIGIVDADTVDESNLQRQIVHGTSTVGVSKCESARRRITDVNPHVKVRTFEEEFTSASALRIMDGGFDRDLKPRWDVVVDGSDNFPTKYLINDACDIVGVPWVYSAILAFEGQVSTFNFPPGIGPTYRDMMPTPPPPGDVPSCAEGGVLGVLPGAMGCIQATEAIKIILGTDPNGILSGRVLVYDALRMKFNEVGLRRLDDRETITELIDYQGFCAGHLANKGTAPALVTADAAPAAGRRTMDEAETATATATTTAADAVASFHTIEPVDCLSKLSDGWTPFVLDVRLKTENDIVALPFTDAVSPHRTVRASDVPPDGDVLVYCKAGVRGEKACNRLIELGIDPDRLYNLDGGIMKWQKDVDNSMPRY